MGKKVKKVKKVRKVKKKRKEEVEEKTENSKEEIPDDETKEERKKRLRRERRRERRQEKKEETEGTSSERITRTVNGLDRKKGSKLHLLADEQGMVLEKFDEYCKQGKNPTNMMQNHGNTVRRIVGMNVNEIMDLKFFVDQMYLGLCKSGVSQGVLG